MAEEKEETKVTLSCGVYGEATVFPVKIKRNAEGSDLQKAIFKDQRHRERFSFPASSLTLYLARKKGETTWMKHDHSVKDFLRGNVDKQFMKLRSSWRLNETELFGPSFTPEDEDIHVLVELPEAVVPAPTIESRSQTYRQSGIVRKERELEEEKAVTKMARLEVNDLSTFATELMYKIHECNVDAIFAIEFVVDLPFPSLLTLPNRFEGNKRGFFTYQTRSELKQLYDKVVSRWLDQRTITVNVAGTIGYGKSHMLAVLVLLLLKNPTKSIFESLPFVCYIPDCRELVGGEDAVVAIMKKNIFLNMPDFIGVIDTIADVRAVLRCQKVIVVADQWNSIDDKDTSCQAAREHLASCLGTSIYVNIHGMSMNPKTWCALLPMQTSADNNIYHGGLNDDEFSTWLHHHPAIFTQHEDELALLTGKVPLLLSVFARAYNDNDSWEIIVQRVQLDDFVEDWKVLLTRFYKSIDGDQVWKVLTLSVDCVLESNIVDFRFFYKDRKLGFCVTNEIVLRLLYQVWSTKSADDALLTRWRDILSRSRNPSVLGFNVKEIVKAQICLQGVVGKYSRPKDWAIQRIRFVPGAEKTVLNQAIEAMEKRSRWILLDPVIFNYAGVDMILVTDTELVGINVTIATTHTPLTPFFKLWGELAKLKNLAIKGLFVAPDNFIHEEENVDLAFLRNVYHELWSKIKNTTIQSPIQDFTCKCKTCCSKTCCSTKRCGCQRRKKLCNRSCDCQFCGNMQEIEA